MVKATMEDKLFNIYLKYPNKWVALNDKKNSVIVSGSNIKEVSKKLQKSKKIASVIMFVEPLNTALAM